ncbi:MAG: peptidoglycan-binding protein LysM [Flavobacterium sp.]|nr:peptidoglycan-binding protein LysM [Flavobacteriales bacterium]
MLHKWKFYSVITIIVLVITTSFKRYEFEPMAGFHLQPGEVLEYQVPSLEEKNYVNFDIPFTGKSFAGFKQALAFKESQGSYKKVNSLGYLGKYQFGKGTLQTIGVRDSLRFMNSPRLQEKSFEALLAINKHELRNEIQKYVGKEIRGVVVTESGILAAAHLGGAGSVKKFLKSNGRRGIKDAYGTSILSYMDKFGGYDTSIIEAKEKVRVKY